jgi:hypothetical protein
MHKKKDIAKSTEKSCQNKCRGKREETATSRERFLKNIKWMVCGDLDLGLIAGSEAKGRRLKKEGTRSDEE